MSETVSISISSFEEAITQLNDLAKDVNELLDDVRKIPFAKDEESYKSRGHCATIMHALSERDNAQSELVAMIITLSSLVSKTEDLLNSAKGKYEAMDNSVAKELR